MKKVVVGLIVVGTMGVSLPGTALEESSLLPDELHGVVVEADGGWALGAAGIRAGDVLLSWKRLPSPPANPDAASGELRSYFSWLELEIEQAPRGIVEIRGERNGESITFRIEPTFWRGEVRPVLQWDHMEKYSRGQNYLTSGETESAIQVWESLRADMKSDKLRTWIAIRSGEALGERGDWERALDWFRSALEIASTSIAQSAVWKLIGNANRKLNAFKEAELAYESALEIRQKLRQDSLGAAEMLNLLGEVTEDYGDLGRARDYHLRALQIRKHLAPRGLKVAESLNGLGVVAWDRGDLDQTYDYFSQSLEIVEKLAPESAETASVLSNLGALVQARGDLSLAGKYYLRAFQIREKIEPHSLKTAYSLNDLGSLSRARGELGQARDYYLQSLQIRSDLAPQSLQVAGTLNNLGTLSLTCGELDAAEKYLTESLRIVERLAPRSPPLAIVLSGLGSVFSARGEWNRAQDYYRRALDIQETVSPESLALADTLNNLGSTAWERGELRVAHAYLRRAYQIQKRLAPESPSTVTTLINLGLVARGLGDLGCATSYYQKALRLEQDLAPESLTMATIFNNLGYLSWKKKALDEAREYCMRALDLSEKLSPHSLDAAFSLTNLGLVAFDRGDLSESHDLHARALAIRNELSSSKIDIAINLNQLGDICRIRGDLSCASDYYDKALEALKWQLSRLGGSYRGQAKYYAHYRKYFRDVLDMLLLQERLSEAFVVSEQFRAQVFLAMLAERDSVADSVLPEELARERRRLVLEYDGALRRLGRHDLPKKDEEAEDIRHVLVELEGRANDLEARIRLTSSRSTASEHLDVVGIQNVLDPGTLLLSYSVGEDRTVLFVLSRTETLQVKILPFGAEKLRFWVRRLRMLISEAAPHTSLSEERRAQFRRESLELYEALLGPAAEQIGVSERLLILPDGPLHSLPFAALGRRGADGEGNIEYLIEWKPFHVALSATVFAELKKRRWANGVEYSGSGTQRFAAFGDPNYPQDRGGGDDYSPIRKSTKPPLEEESSCGDSSLPVSIDRNIFGWQPLTHSRHEIESIARIYPEGTVRTFLGPKALEERVKTLERQTNILHLAAHVYTDEHLPMNSFIALTIPDDPDPDQDNGLLQVWEIFERVRIDADLVVLSACESGLGEELGGEGLIGLTRAFQYAGARSVIASLWSVADRTTAELMIRFYRHLRSGLSKDEALRAAQMELIRGPIEVTDENGKVIKIDASSPYYWAAFQVYGDWK